MSFDGKCFSCRAPAISSDGHALVPTSEVLSGWSRGLETGKEMGRYRGFAEGAAVAFGLLGMACAIRERYADGWWCLTCDHITIGNACGKCGYTPWP